MRARRPLVIVGAVVVALALFLGGVVVGGHPEATGLTRLSDPLRGVLLGQSGQDLGSQVLQVLRSDYYRPVDAAKLEQSSVDAMLKDLNDPYTTYLDPTELAALRTANEGAYFGVGLQVSQRGRNVVVTRVFAGSPAAEAGIRAGDRIVSVGGTAVRGQALEAVVTRIRGPERSTVQLGVAAPGGTPRDVTLTRGRVKVPAVDSHIATVRGTPVGYVHLAQFTRGSGDALRGAVASLRQKGAKALVLDLRGDPGGLVDEAIDVASAFLPDHSVVVVTQGLHSPRTVYRTDTAPVAGNLPMMVLVDRGSASASEIVAGALRDAGRGRLVGERTFGKALVQSTRLLRDGGALKLTTAHYLTPKGFNLAKRGLPPSVKVVDNPQTGHDEALQRALELAAAAA